MDEDLAEEIGLHIGDGSMNYYSRKGFFQLRGHYIDDKPHYETRVRKLYKTLYSLDINIRDMVSTGVMGFQIWSDAIVGFKNKILGIPLGKKDNIGIPKSINNKKLFFSLMKGLFDTDGCLYIENRKGKLYPRIEIRTISKKLCSQIVVLLNKYKLPPKCFKYERKEANWNNIYTIRFNGFTNLENWISCIGTNNPKHIKKINLVDL